MAQAAAAGPPPAAGFRSMADALAALRTAKAANAGNAAGQPDAAPAAAAAPAPDVRCEASAETAPDAGSKANPAAAMDADRNAEPAPPPAAGAAAPAPGPKPVVAKEDIDKCSGLVVGKRRTSKLDVELAISSARLVKLRDLVSFARTIPAEVKAVPDWAVGGALAEKSSATTHAGESYLRWKIADLAGNVAMVLLFSDACKTHWKVQEGDIVVLHRPNLLRSNERNVGVSLTVRKAGDVLLPGSAADFGRCRGVVAQTNQPCRVAINKRDGVEYCPYHLGSAIKRMSSARMDLNSIPQPRLPKAKEMAVPKERNQSSGTYNVGPPMTAEQKARERARLAAEQERQKAASDAFMAKFLERNPGMRSQVPGFMKAPTDASSSSSGTGIPTPKPTFDSATIRKLGFNPSTGVLHNANADPSMPKLGRGFTASPAILLDSNDATKAKLAALVKSGAFQPAKKEPHVPTDAELRRREEAARRAESSGDENVRPAPARAATASGSEPAAGIDPAPPARALPKFASTAGAAAGAVKSGTSTAGSKRAAPSSAGARSGSSSPPKKKKPESLADLVSITADSVQGRKVLQSSGQLGDVAKEMLHSQWESHVKRLSKLEALSTAAQNVMELTVKAVHCTECNLLLETARELCKQNRHTLTPQNARKRFFKCQNCQQRTEALNCIMPEAACARCGSTDYLRVGMRDPPKGPELNKLQTHIEDHPPY